MDRDRPCKNSPEKNSISPIKKGPLFCPFDTISTVDVTPSL